MALRLEIEVDDIAAIVRLAGNLDAVSSKKWGKAMIALREHSLPHLIVDLHGLESLGKHGAELLGKLFRWARERQKTLWVCNPRKQVQEQAKDYRLGAITNATFYAGPLWHLASQAEGRKTDGEERATAEKKTKTEKFDLADNDAIFAVDEDDEDMGLNDPFSDLPSETSEP